MKKTGKRLVSFLLAIIMMVSVMTPSAFAQEAAPAADPGNEPVREYIYEILPVAGLHVESGITKAQLQEQLASERPTVTVKGSQNGQHEVPVVWDVEGSDFPISFYWNPIYTVTGNLDLSGHPYLINADNVQAEIKVAVNERTIRRITRIEAADISDIEVPYGTSRYDLGLPTKANAFVEGEQEPTEVNITWSEYYPNFVGEQRLVATLDLPDDMEYDHIWRQVAMVTVLPPEGIRSIEASQISYELPCGEYYYSYFDRKYATITFNDGTKREVPVTSQQRDYGKEESVLCGKTDVHMPCIRRCETVDLSSVEGYSNITAPTAIAERVEARDRTERNLVSVAYNYDLKFCKGYLKGDITYSNSIELTVDLGGQTVTCSGKAIWDVDNFVFDGNTAGEYTLYGDVDLSETDIKNPSNVRVTAKVQIVDIPLFLTGKSVEEYPADLSVEPGTSKEKVKELLDSEYSNVKVRASWNQEATLPVTWDVENSDYQETAGVYFVRGTYNTSGRSVFLPEGSFATARINVGNALKKVSKVEYSELGNKTVSYGTTFEELNLPAQAQIYLEDAPEEPINVDIEWSEYIPTLVGTQFVRSTLVLPNYIDYSQTYNKQSLEVTVAPPEGMESYSGSEMQLSPRCTTLEAIQKLLQYDDYLDAASTVVLSNGETHEIPITWSETPYPSTASLKSSTITFDQDSPCYHIQGEVDFSSIPGFESVPNGTVLFEFREGWDRFDNQVFSVDQAGELRVERGTTAEEVQTMLSTQYPELRVHLNAELYLEDTVCPIIWDVASSDYNRFVEGTYTIFGDIDLTGADAMMEEGEVRARALVTVGGGGSPIASVEELEPLVMSANSLYLNIVNPALKENRPEVTVTLQNGEKATLPVLWDVQDLVYGDHSEGTYTLFGDLDLSGHPEISNPEKYRAELTLELKPAKYISEDVQVEGLEVGIGISPSDLQKMLEEKYPQVKAPVGSSEEIIVPVIWDSSKFTLDPSTPGVYMAEGEFDLSEALNISNYSYKVKTQITVKDYPTVIGDVVFQSQSFESNTITAEQLQADLESKYPGTTITLSDGTPTNVDITWDVSASGFDGSVPGTYTVCGELKAKAGKTLYNPEQYQAKIDIIIPASQPPEIRVVSIDTLSMTTDQHTYLKPTDKKYQLQGSLSLATPPETVTVHFSNGNAAQFPVNWNVEEFDPAKATGEGEAPQRITGEIVVPEGSRIVNPDHIQAQLDITVTGTTLKVAQASPKEISVEVYRGTTLEELNQQLEAEGKNEISILATTPKNTVKRTFGKVFLEASQNPDWESVKDVCGTYTLTASWPESIKPRTAKVPGPIHINVTVLEPLEITGTKLAKMDMYQGVEPENAENIPSQVTAILSDGSEVDVDVQWDWSFYNKNAPSNPPVIGKLVNLPRKAKQPEGEEITGNMAVLMIPVAYTIQERISSNTFTAKAGLTLEEITALSGKEGSGIPSLDQTFKISGMAEDNTTVTTTCTVPAALSSESNPEFSPTDAKAYTLTAAMSLPENISTEGFADYNRIELTTQPVEILSLEPVSVIDREGTEFAALENVPDTVLATLDVKGPDGAPKTVSLSVDWGEGAGYTPLPEGLTEENPVTMTVNGTLVDLPAYLQPTSLLPTLSVTLGREFDIIAISPARIPETGTLDVNLGTEFSAIDGQLNHEVELTLLCTNGEEKKQTVSFTLSAEDNPGYDPLVQDTYHLTGKLLVGGNVKNPANLSVEVVVRTVKHRITAACALDDIYMGVGEDVMKYLPATVPAECDDGNLLIDVPTTWDITDFDGTPGAFNVVFGTYVLPVYLENPDDCQPIAFVMVDDSESEIVSMTQLSDSGSAVSQRAARQDKVIPGYEKHIYRVERLYQNGSTKEQVLTLYSKAN